MQVRFRTQGLASVRVGKTECCTVRARLRQKLPRQMVGADAAGAVIGSAELLPAGAALRLCRGLPPGKLRSGDGPDVKNGAAHSLTTTGPSGGRRHIPAER